MTTDNPLDSIGRRVKSARKLAGITQQQLAMRAHVSLSLVKQVEQGKTPASPAFAAATARALGIAATDLTDQPYPVEDRDDHRVHSVIPALRREVAAYLLPPDDGVIQRPLDQLAAAVAHTSKLRHSAALDSLAAELPTLLAELRAASTTPTTPNGNRYSACLPRHTQRPGKSRTNLGTPTCPR